MILQSLFEFIPSCDRRMGRHAACSQVALWYSWAHQKLVIWPSHCLVL